MHWYRDGNTVKINITFAVGIVHNIGTYKFINSIKIISIKRFLNRSKTHGILGYAFKHFDAIPIKCS